MCERLSKWCFMKAVFGLKDGVWSEPGRISLPQFMFPIQLENNMQKASSVSNFQVTVVYKGILYIVV